MPNLVGTGLNQVPTNSMLGGLAYQDPEHASIKDLDLKNLSQINSEISDTAVDVFVYDTRKDSDGGAWRKRTQHTSWYNETLNTSTRGSRREFPAVAVIVAETTKVTIYDGDDPDLPMWMVFTWSGNVDNLLGYSNRAKSAITAVNGYLITCSDPDGIHIARFVHDDGIRYTHVNHVYTSDSIANRTNTTYRMISNSSPQLLVAATCNDIAATVLPNAPIDEVSELPVPTIAVATDGGVSIIKDDNTVFDWTETSGPNSAHKVNFRKDNKLGVYTSGTSGATAYPQLYYIDLPSSDIDSNYYYNFSALNFERYGGTAWETNATNNLVLKSPATNPTTHNLTDMADTPNLTYAATNGGLNSIIRPKAINHSTGRAEMLSAAVAYIQKDYNTGYMYGDIKGAFLSDTDTTNITGSEKIANYNFAADFSTQWEAKNNANTSYDATNDRVTVTSTQNYSGIRLKSASLPTLTNGKRYIMTVDIHSINNPIRFGVVSGGTKDGVNSTGSHTLTFTAGASITEVFVEKPTGSNSTFVLNSVSIREVEEDRSVNNKGLQVYGTITKSAVATGADLVAYSGFSSSNYLENRSDYDFGAGASVSMCIIGWFKTTNISTYTYIMSVYDSGTDHVAGLAINASSAGGANPAGTLYTYDSVTSQLSGTSVVNDGQWHCAVGIFDGPNRKIYLDGKLEVSNTFTSYSVDIADTDKLTVGRYAYNDAYNFLGSLALTRISKSIPSAEQIRKIYEDEKHLFEENAKATLYGSSDAVTALAYDDSTNLLYAGTSSGRSEFQGLRRINNTTTAVTTAISASNGLIAEQ